MENSLKRPVFAQLKFWISKKKMSYKDKVVFERIIANYTLIIWANKLDIIINNFLNNED